VWFKSAATKVGVRIVGIRDQCRKLVGRAAPRAPLKPEARISTEVPAKPSQNQKSPIALPSSHPSAKIPSRKASL
jgi:hypothetical protein